MNQSADIIIIGGGPIGCLAALELASHNISSLILDQTPQEMIANPLLEGRTIALSYASVALLKKLHLFEKLQDKAAPIENIVVSNGPKGQRLHYGQKESDGEFLGHNVDLTALKNVLLEAIQSSSNTRLLAPFKVTRFVCTQHDVTVFDEAGTEINGIACLAADGKFSPIRHKLALPTREWSYDQVAFVFNVHHTKPHHNFAYEAFLPKGPFASLPTVDPNQSSIIWTVPTKQALPLKEMDDSAFRTTLNDTFDVLGTLTPTTALWTYPLSGLLVSKPYKERVLLLGDAAHAMHPVAGQGLNVGIGDVIVLGNLMQDYRKLGLDIGGVTLFREFSKQRRFDVLAMTFTTDHLVRLFSNHSITLNFMRDQGLKMVDRSSLLKRFFTQKAMGKA